MRSIGDGDGDVATARDECVGCRGDLDDDAGSDGATRNAGNGDDETVRLAFEHVDCGLLGLADEEAGNGNARWRPGNDEIDGVLGVRLRTRRRVHTEHRSFFELIGLLDRFDADIEARCFELNSCILDRDADHVRDRRDLRVRVEEDDNLLAFKNDCASRRFRADDEVDAEVAVLFGFGAHVETEVSELGDDIQARPIGVVREFERDRLGCGQVVLVQ